MSEISQAVGAAARTAASVSSSVYNAAKRVVRVNLLFSIEVMRAHYNILGQYTYPLEQNPPSLSSVSCGGQLFLAPLAALAWFASVTAVPLVMNTLASIVKPVNGLMALSTYGLPNTESYIDGWQKEDSRNAIQKLYGMGGTAVGLGLGITLASVVVVCRAIADSAMTLTATSQAIINLALHRDDKISFCTDGEDTRHLFRQYGLGWFGLVGGLLVGSSIALAISLLRVVINSLKTATPIFARMVNWLAEKLGYLNDVDTVHLKDFGLSRPWLRKYIVGAPGIPLGVLMGLVGCSGLLVFKLFHILLIGLKHTGITSIALASNIIDAFLHHDDQLKLKDDRKNQEKYAWGLLGLPLGLFVGLSSAVFITLGRIATNTVKTTDEVRRAILHAVYGDRFALPEQPSRHIFAKYGLGLLGVFGGIMLGVLGTAGIKLTQWVKAFSIQSGLSLRSAFLHTIKHFIPEPTETYKDDRSWQQKYSAFLHTIKQFLSEPTETYKGDRSWQQKYIAGGLGGIAGGILGLTVGLSIVTPLRILHDTCLITLLTFNSWFEQSTLAYIQKRCEEGNELHHFIFGCLGFVTGISSAILADNGRTLIRVASMILNKFLYVGENQIAINKDTRDVFRKYILNIPGAFAGVGMGFILLGLDFIGATAIGAYYQSIKMLNAVLPSDKLFKLSSYTSTFISEYPLKVSLGRLIGLPFGVALSAVAAVIRLVSNSAKSWLALSKSLINVAAARKWFKGVGADVRSVKLKWYGALGYAIAMFTTLPFVALPTFLLRHSFEVAIFSVALFASPLVFTTKLIATCFSTPKTRPLIYDQKIEDGFDNINNAITAMGLLPEGERINPGSSSCHPGIFLRKSMTFNTNTVTEKTLKMIRQKYWDYAGGVTPERAKAFFSDDNYSPIVNELKRQYESDLCCCISDKESRLQQEECESVARFIQRYMQNHMNGIQTDVPTDLYPSDLPWQAYFFNGQQEQAVFTDQTTGQVLPIPFSSPVAPTAPQNMPVGPSAPSLSSVAVV